MKLSPVKQFVKNNVKRFTIQKKSNNKIAYLFDENNKYIGEYNYNINRRSDYRGVKASSSNTKIFDGNLKPIMQEMVITNREFVDIKAPLNDEKTKSVVKSIDIITTTLDYIHDEFITILKSKKLKNNLNRIGKDDRDFVYTDKFVVFEELTEKLQYETQETVLKKGSIKEVNNQQRKSFNKMNFPYKYW